MTIQFAVWHFHSQRATRVCSWTVDCKAGERKCKSTHCPRDVCNINVTSVLAPGHVQLLANNAYLNSSSHTTCSANLTCNLCSGLKLIDCLFRVFCVMLVHFATGDPFHTWIFAHIVAHLEQNLWPPMIAVWCARRRPFYQHNFERPEWSRLRLRSYVPDPSHHLSNTNPNQKLIGFFFNLFNVHIYSIRNLNEKVSRKRYIKQKKIRKEKPPHYSMKYLLQLKHTDRSAYKKKKKKIVNEMAQ